MANIAETSVVKIPDKTTAESWVAWIDKMPPPPDQLHVHGSVPVGNPGVDPFLFRRVPQGINPKILQLNLVLVQRPGIWPMVVVEKPVTYHETRRTLDYDTVEIYEENQLLVSIAVEIVQ